jgi:hypothetical protein
MTHRPRIHLSALLGPRPVAGRACSRGRREVDGRASVVKHCLQKMAEGVRERLRHRHRRHPNESIGCARAGVLGRHGARPDANATIQMDRDNSNGTRRLDALPAPRAAGGPWSAPCGDTAPSCARRAAPARGCRGRPSCGGAPAANPNSDRTRQSRSNATIQLDCDNSNRRPGEARPWGSTVTESRAPPCRKAATCTRRSDQIGHDHSNRIRDHSSRIRDQSPQVPTCKPCSSAAPWSPRTITNR